MTRGRALSSFNFNCQIPMDDRRIPLQAAIAAITHVDSHTYRSSLTPDHCLGKTAHGGFLSSLIHQVVQQHFQTTLHRYNQLHTFNLHVFFLRSVTAGDVTLKVQDTKPGSEISITHVTLTQGGKEKVVTYASNVNMQNGKGVGFDTGYEMTPKPIMADLEVLSNGTDGRWVGFTFPWHPKSLLKASTYITMFMPTAGPPRPDITDVWLTPSSPNESFTTETLGYVADCWHRIPENTLPHATWSNASIISTAHQVAEGLLRNTEIGCDPPRHWYPTLTMSLEIKKLLPRVGVKWLFVRAQAKEVRSGRMDVEVMIFDRGMGLVALSHQLCFVVENFEAQRQKQRSSRGKL